MRAAPPPRRAQRRLRGAVRGAVQPVTSAPSSALLNRRMPGQAITQTAAYDRRYLAQYQEWQNEARRAARTTGVARFAATMVSATAARVIIRVEEQDDNGDWDETADPHYSRLMNEYRNETLGQGPSELVRLHTHHYSVAGEGCVLHRDLDRGGVEWMVLSTPAIDFGRPSAELATVSLIPAGQVLDGTAFVLPRDQIIRFWMPDEDWLGFAVSPMTAAMDDLGRYQSLARYARRQANNYLAMNGALWTPSAAHESENVPDDAALDSDDSKQSELLQAYEEMAKVSLNDIGDDMLEAVIPPMWWWKNSADGGGPPEWVEIGRPLDEHGRSYREEALTDYARDLDIPSSLVVGGGSDTESNHWQAWMTKDRFAAMVAPTLDRVTHQDLTVAFLYPLLRLNGVDDVSRYRVGYDPYPAIKPQDEADKALKAWLSGLLAAKPALAAMGFDPGEIATEEDLTRLMAVLHAEHRSASGPTGPVKVTTPAGPGNTVEGPPSSNPNEVPGVPTLPPTPTPASMLAPYLPGGVQFTRSVVDSSGPGMTAAAHNPTGTGIMVSLDVPPDVAKGLAVADGEPADAMHVTLVHVSGGVDETDPSVQPVLAGAAEMVAAEFEAPKVDLTHVERFVASDETGDEPVVLVDSGPEVYELREKLVGVLDEGDCGYSDDHGFRCHVTLGYWPPGEGPEAGPLAVPVSFVPTGISLHWGADVSTYQFAPTADESGASAAFDAVLDHGDNFAAAVESAPTFVAAEVKKAEVETRRTLQRLSRVRRDVGREVAAMAELAFAEALRHAGVRATTRARNRSGAGLARSVAAALEQGTSLSPFLAQLGVDQERLLANAFDGFQTKAAKVLARGAETSRTAVDDEPDSQEDVRRAEAAAAFLAAVLLTLARRRIIEGETPAGGVGEVSGVLPSRFVANAVGIAEGRLAPTFADSLDVLPTAASTNVVGPEVYVADRAKVGLLDRLSSELRRETDPDRAAALERGIEQAQQVELTTYQWAWGFWGEPTQAFEPHQALDGVETTDPETDPAFANDGDWPDGDYYQPQDHDGCGCELVPVGSDVGSTFDGS